MKAMVIKITSVEEYLNKIKLYLKDITDLQKSGGSYIDSRDL